MKSTKKFKLKQAIAYGGIVAVLGGTIAGIAVGISNNTEKTLLLNGQDAHYAWSDSYTNKDVVAHNTKFIPYDSDEYAPQAMAPSFRISTARAKDNSVTGLYISNGFRIETGELDEYDAQARDGSTVHVDLNFTKHFGFKDGNKGFITELNESLLKQTSSIILNKAIQFRVSTASSPFYADMENSSGLGVASGTAGENAMVSVAYVYKYALLDFVSKYSSTTLSEPINKLANLIGSTIPSDFATENDLTSFIASNKTKIDQWNAKSITIPGNSKTVSFKDYMHKSMLGGTVYEIVSKSLRSALNQNIDYIRQFEGDNLPDSLSKIYKDREDINGRYLGTKNHNGMSATPESIKAIESLLTYDNAGGTGKAYNALRVFDTFDNLVDSATASKRYLVSNGQMKLEDDQYDEIPYSDYDVKYKNGSSLKYDKASILQKGLILKPQIKNVASETLLSTPNPAKKTIITNIIKAVTAAAQYKIDKKDDEAEHETDKWTNASNLISSVFDGPSESTPSLEQIAAISYNESSNEITADLNVPSKIYFQTLFNEKAEGITDEDKNADQLTKSLSTLTSALNWNEEASEKAKDIKPTHPLLKDMDGNDIAGSDFTISFLNHENVKTMASKAKTYMAAAITNKSANYQQASKLLIKDLIKNEGAENQFTKKVSLGKGTYFKLTSDGDIEKDSEGNPMVSQASVTNYINNIYTSKLTDVLAQYLTVATLKFDDIDDYNYVAKYLGAINKARVGGKQIIDDASGNFDTKFQKDIYTLLSFLNKEDEDVITGIAVPKTGSSVAVAGYQIFGYVPKGTVISKLKIGEASIGVHMSVNVGGVLTAPGSTGYGVGHEFSKDVWVSDVFNVGNYKDSIFMAPKSAGKDEFKEKLQILDDSGKDWGSTFSQEQFDTIWAETANYYSAVSDAYALSKGVDGIYMSVFNNRKGV